MPEVLWKAYIDFEVEQEEWERTRILYERLLEKTKHLKVWFSYAKFEISVEEIELAREVRNGDLTEYYNNESIYFGYDYGYDLVMTVNIRI